MPESKAPQLAFALNRAIAKLEKYAPALGDQIYHWVDKNDILWTNGTGWTDGFWGGLLWLVYEHTGDKKWMEMARGAQHWMDDRLDAGLINDHDMGFRYSLTSVADFVNTGSREARQYAIQAARVLAARYNAKGQFIQAWNPRPTNTPEHNRELLGKAIIDCMMNQPLLWWASQVTGDKKYAEIAHAHSHTSMEVFYRKDGSSYHTFNFDHETGERLCGKTHQGYADESTWSRGHAWGLYGFALAYTCTGAPEYLQKAREAAQWWLANTPACAVPPWDFNASEENRHLVDTSAALCAACGLFEIARHVDAEEAATYRAFAEQACLTVNEKYLQSEAHVGLVNHGVSSLPHGRGITVNLIYNDYFYIEALLRSQGRFLFHWCPNPVV